MRLMLCRRSPTARRSRTSRAGFLRVEWVGAARGWWASSSRSVQQPGVYVLPSRRSTWRRARSYLPAPTSLTPVMISCVF